MDPWLFFGGLAFGAIFGGIGAAALLVARRSRRIAAASLQWPSVPAQITESTVVDSTDSDGDRTYAPRVVYTYRAAGQERVSRRLRADGGMAITSSSAAKAQAELAAYPVGATVKAYYDPNRPDYAILEAGSTKAARLQTIIGGIFLPIGLVAIAATCVLRFYLQ